MSRPLQAAGVIALIMSGGHYVTLSNIFSSMGANELAPKIRPLQQLESSTALSGWYQGCFMYAAFGLNYLRLAGLPVALYTGLDKAILGVQLTMHLFTAYGLKQTPPRVLSGVLISLVGLGLAL